MTRFIALTVLLLGLCSAAEAAPRDPAAFTSLGNLTPSASAATINIDTAATPPTMSGGATFTGVVDNGVAVFCFANVNVPAGVALSATGTRPLVILSQGDFFFAGVLTAIGSATVAGPGGYAGALAPAYAGSGPGGGTGGDFGGGSGGGFGGAGGSVTSSTTFAPGGTAYGNVLTTLEGGSGGGRSWNSGTPTPPADGGGGGGAVELGATGTLTIDASGTVNCKGTAGAVGFYGGGGGAGGGILIHAASGTIAGILDASGGEGGQTVAGHSGGGGGGGGRIHTANLTITGTLSVGGGQGGSGATGTFGGNGANGAITSASAGAGPLDPAAFTSLGDFAPTAAVTIDTGAVVTNPTMSGGATFTGVFTASGIAVFCFDDVDVPAGVTLTVTGKRPLAILSKGDFNFAGIVDANGGDVNLVGTDAGPGGYDGATAPGNGFGPGAGSGSQNGGAGGGFGGAGGNAAFGAPGGAAYGDMTSTLQGGSGGGNSQFGTTNGFGGGGGGAVEFGATGTMTIGSGAEINVKGANGGMAQGSQGSSPQGEGGGAGAGGGVLLHAASGTMAGAINANGGWGGDSNNGQVGYAGFGGGGGGGGGRVHTVNLTVTGTIDVGGGPGGWDASGHGGAWVPNDGFPGAAGVITSSAAASSPVITSTAPTTATVGVLYQYTITTTGSPTPGLSVTGEPAWLTLNGNVLEGTPAASDVGPHGPFTLTATNSQGTDSEQITITVQDLEEIEVEDPNGNQIADGGSFSGASGTAVGLTTTYTFTINNIGSQDLTVGTPQVTAGSNCTATLNAAPAGTVTPGTDTTFSVDVAPMAAGAWDFSVTFSNSDANENPFDFTVDGNAAAAPTPEMDVEDSSGAAIAVGTTVTATNNGAAGVTATLVYTIRNTGSLTLNITGVQVTAGANCTATLASSPAVTVTPGGSTSFDVDVTPAASGAWLFDVSIDNDDSNENPYDFTVDGSATAAPANEMEMLASTGPLADGGTHNAGGIGGYSTTLTYMIRNTGSAPLNLTGNPVVAISNEVNCTVQVTTAPAATLAPSGTTNFVLEVTASSSGSFSFDVSIDNDDANENPYDFQVAGNTGGSTGAPKAGGSSNGGGCAAVAGQNWAALAGLFSIIAIRLRRRR